MLQPLTNPVHLLVPLEPEAEQALAETFSEALVFRRRAVLLRQGETPNGIRVIRHGCAFRSKVSAGGRRQIVGLVTDGQFCNLRSLFVESADHFIQAVTDCEIATAPRQDFLNLIEAYPAIGRALLAQSLADEAIAHEWILNVGRRPARQRVAHLLCEILMRVRDDHHELTCMFPMMQENIADATGLSVVYINRNLQDFRNEGLITIQRNLLQVHDWQTLCAVADFDASYLPQLSHPCPG